MSTASMNGARPIGAGVPPHNLEAERSVLGAILLDERHLATLFADERLRPEHFYRRASSQLASKLTSTQANL